MIGLLVVGAIGVIGWGSPAAQQFGCVFNTTSKLGCQTGQATILSGTQSVTVTFPNAFAKTPQSIGLTLLANNLAKIIITVSYTIWGGDKIWLNMPIAQTDLFGTLPECCISLVTPAQGDGSNCVTGDMIVNVITPSNNASALLRLQTATPSPTGWLNTGVTVSIANGGVGQAVATLPSTSGGTNAYLKVVGENGGGAGDNPELGTIQVACSTATITTGFVTIHSTLPAPSATSFRIDISSKPLANQVVIWTAIAT